MPRQLPRERPDKWSHLTDRLTSSTPGFLNEIYYGEVYRVTSGPSYGPNMAPSARDLEKALSPVKIIDRSSQTWWERARKTPTCSLVAAIFLHVLFWGFMVVMFLMVIGKIKTPFGKARTILPTEGGMAAGADETSVIQAPTNTSVPVVMVSTEETGREVPLGSIVENSSVESKLPHGFDQTTFLTLVKRVYPEQPTIYN